MARDGRKETNLLRELMGPKNKLVAFLGVGTSALDREEMEFLQWI